MLNKKKNENTMALQSYIEDRIKKMGKSKLSTKFSSFQNMTRKGTISSKITG